MVRRALSALLLVFAAYAAEQRFVYLLPADSAVSLQANLVYKTTSTTNLHFDLYRPANQAAALPVVVFMQGVGSGNMREWTRYKGWGRLVTTAAHHGFDISDDNETSRRAIARTLDFMKASTQPSAQRETLNGVPEATAAAAVYRGDWQAAVKAYEALAANRPNDAEVQRNFGNALYGVGEYKRALAAYEHALELGNPNVGWVSYSAASSLMKLGEPEKALKYIEKLADILPMRRRLNSDPDFAPLKDKPRFRAIADRN